MHGSLNFMYITGQQVPAKTKVHWSPQWSSRWLRSAWRERKRMESTSSAKAANDQNWRRQPLTHSRKELAILAGKVHVD